MLLLTHVWPMQRDFADACAIPNRQNLLRELYRTEFSVQKIPICEQLPYYSLHSSDLNQSLYFS